MSDSDFLHWCRMADLGTNSRAYSAGWAAPFDEHPLIVLQRRDGSALPFLLFTPGSGGDGWVHQSSSPTLDDALTVAQRHHVAHRA